MSRVADYLANKSRIAALIADVEGGNPLDLEKAAMLQALDVARIGELAVADHIDRSTESNDQLKQLINGN